MAYPFVVSSGKTNKMMGSWLLLFLVFWEFRWILTAKVLCPITMDLCRMESMCCRRELSELPLCPKNFPTLVSSSKGFLGFESNILETEIHHSKIRFSLFHLFNGLWIPIKSCCQVAVNESCKLPPIKTGKYASIAWTRNEGRAFCRSEVKPGIQRLRWCDGISRNHCLALRSGNLHFTKSASAGSQRSENAEFCMFHAPNNYVLLRRSTFDRNTVTLQAMELNGDRVKADDFEASCMLFDSFSSTSVSSRLSSYNYRPGFTACTFVRIRGYGWVEEPLCLTDGLPECHRDFVLHLSILGMLLGVLVLVVIVRLIVACRKYIKAYVPSYEATVATGLLSQILDEEAAKETSCNSENSSFTQAGIEQCHEKGYCTNRSERYITTSHLYPSWHVQSENVHAIVPVTRDRTIDDTCGLMDATDQDLQFKRGRTEAFSHDENENNPGRRLNKESLEAMPPGTNDDNRIYQSISFHDDPYNFHVQDESVDTSKETNNLISYLPKPISVANSYTSK